MFTRNCLRKVAFAPRKIKNSISKYGRRQSASAKVRDLVISKLLNIVLETRSNERVDERVDSLYEDLIAEVKDKKDNKTAFINFQTAHDYLKNDDHLFKLRALEKHINYSQSDLTPTWESINTEYDGFADPFELKFACKSPGGQTLAIDDPSFYKVFVKLRTRRLKNLWDYATTLGNEVDLHAHRRLFSILLVSGCSTNQY